jgi:phospholipid/cholesterol/gamma-HCH transport system substrate-binding protein
MAKKANPKLIGGFVIGAIALVLIGIIAFGGGKFLAPKDKAVLFFASSSLSGLDVGSPVTFRGVKIGSVTRIVIHYEVDKQTLQIPVYIEIEPDRVEIVGGQRGIKNLQALVERGLRGQLAVQSLVTGQAIINFDFHPDTPIMLVGAEPGMIELPTIPSDFDVLKANLTSVLQRIAKLPLDEIAARSLETVKTANEFLANLNAQVQPLSGDLKSVTDQTTLTLKEARARLELREGEPMQNLNSALINARQLIDDVDKGVAPIVANSDRLVKTTLATMEQARRTLQTVQVEISPDSTLNFQINRTLHEIQTMATSIRAFSDYMQRHPDALLIGRH